MSEKTPRLNLNPKTYIPSIKKQRISLKWIFGSKVTIKIFGVKIFESKKSRQ